MAFSWSLVATESVSGGIDQQIRLCVNSAGNKVYFIATGKEIYEWDGTTLTSLGFNTWVTANYSSSVLVDVAWFNGSLYAAFNGFHASVGNTVATIAKYSGSWSEVMNVVDDFVLSHQFDTSSNSSDYRQYLNADNSRIIATAGNAFNSKLIESTDGASWAIPQISAADIAGWYYHLGLRKKARRSVVSMEGNNAVPHDNYHVVEYSSGWARLATNIGEKFLLGYLDSLSHFVINDGGTYKLAHSNDWGATHTLAGGPTTTNSADRYRFMIFDIDDAAQIMNPKVTMTGGDRDDVFVWNPSTNQWVYDSTVGAVPYGFFKINNQLFALCSGGAGVAKIYSGGALGGGGGAAKFYYGINALTERSDLPFGLVNPACMAVRSIDGKVALGGDAVGGGGEIVITKSVDDNYVADTDITDSHATGSAINGIQWINGS